MRSSNFFLLLIFSVSIICAQGPVDGFIYPADQMSQGWSYYDGRSFYCDNNHLGADIDLVEGTAVKAIAKGKIVFYGPAGGYGELVAVIEHELPCDMIFTNANGNKVTTRYILSIYGHLRKSQQRNGTELSWSINQNIQKGHTIGYINDDPNNGDGLEHLHLAIRLSNKLTAESEDPIKWFRGYKFNNDGTNSGMQIHFTDPIFVVANIGNYFNGFHGDGTSQAFIDKFNQLKTEGVNIGWPCDHNSGSVFVHEYFGSDNSYSVICQDFINSSGERSMLILNDLESPPKAYHLKQGFWWHYVNNDGPKKYGVPFTDEKTGKYANSSKGANDFINPGQIITVQKFKLRKNGAYYNNQRRTLVYNPAVSESNGNVRHFPVGECQVVKECTMYQNQWYFWNNPLLQSAGFMPWPMAGVLSPNEEIWFSEAGYYTFSRLIGGLPISTVVHNVSEGNIQFLSPDPIDNTAPTGISASVSENNVNLNWNIINASNFQNYKVYRSASLSGTYVAIATVNDNSHTDASLTDGTYYYKLSAMYSNGESGQSAAVS